MNFIREVVGGPKNRYRQEGYNLDLTYITSRIVAMAFPASGIEKLYRNSIDAVAEFLETNHKDSYMILNISNRDIDEKKLKNVKSFEWEDHKSPPIELLFYMVDVVVDFMTQKKQNVALIHCNHGKGRTGTFICCLLVYLNAFSTEKQAMQFYAKRRFQAEGMGVTQPCQISYINYFGYLLQNPKLRDQPLILTKIQLQGDHKLTKPYFKIKNIKKQNYIVSTKKKEEMIMQIQKNNQYTIKFIKGVRMIGDIILEIKSQETMGKNLVAYFPFNTSLISLIASEYKKQKKFFIGLDNLSPLSAIKSGNFAPNFKITLTFRSCIGCKDSQLCVNCLDDIQSDSQNWLIINNIIQNRYHKYQIDSYKIYGEIEKGLRTKRSNTMEK